MSSSRGLALSGVAGAILAVSLIALIAFTGGAMVMKPQSTGGNGSNTTGVTTSSGGQTTSTTGGTLSSGSGVLSVLLTDPPHVPQGVTAVYAAYTSIQVREEGLGWVSMNSSGEVELMGTVNVALTLTSAKIPQGTYDAIRLDISSATVTYLGKNYSATVQGGSLLIGIRGGDIVDRTHSSAAIIDIQPTVVNIGTQTSPEFVMRPVAMAFPVPSASVIQSMDRDGNRFSLMGMQWWSDYRSAYNSSLELTGASLSSSSLSVALKNSGSQSIQVWMVVVTGASLLPLNYTGHMMPVAMLGTAMFFALPNGTLLQFSPLLHAGTTMMTTDPQPTFLQYFGQGGYNLTAGSSATLKFSGNIAIGAFMMMAPHGIISGDKYWVTVIGDEAVASMEVTAA